MLAELMNTQLANCRKPEDFIGMRKSRQSSPYFRRCTQQALAHYGNDGVHRALELIYEPANAHCKACTRYA